MGSRWEPIYTPVVPSPAARPAAVPQSGPDHNESAREWGRVCGMLEAGVDAETVYGRLIQRAASRRGNDVERYARRTMEQALRRVAQGTSGHR